MLGFSQVRPGFLVRGMIINQIIYELNCWIIGFKLDQVFQLLRFDFD